VGLWRALLRLLGLSGDARVHVSAPGVDVVITGDPDQVRALLVVVKHELERNARLKDRESRRTTRRSRPLAMETRRSQHPQQQLTPSRASQFVQPTELDEMDSPYALPELVKPVEDTDESPPEETTPSRELITAAEGTEPATLVPEIQSSAHTSADLSANAETPPLVRSFTPFVTDGGPTVFTGAEPVPKIAPRADSDAEETKESSH
jgi:hypothetical protein